MKLLLSMVATSCLVALNTSCPAQTPQTGTTPAQPATQAEPAAQAQTAPATTPAVSTAQVVICREVAERSPVDAAESFGADAGTLMCFSNVVGAEEPVQVYHRWYVGDQMVAEIPINVKAASWRCWSRKTIAPSWTGPCHVDVVTESGDTIGSATFTLTSAAAPATEAAPQG